MVRVNTFVAMYQNDVSCKSRVVSCICISGFAYSAQAIQTASELSKCLYKTTRVTSYSGFQFEPSRIGTSPTSSYGMQHEIRNANWGHVLALIPSPYTQQFSLHPVFWCFRHIDLRTSAICIAQIYVRARYEIVRTSAICIARASVAS